MYLFFILGGHMNKNTKSKAHKGMSRALVMQTVNTLIKNKNEKIIIIDPKAEHIDIEKLIGETNNV